jgi:hypothetical protein
MLTKDLRNTLGSIEDSVDRASGTLSTALGDLRPLLEDMARDVHNTCLSVQRASDRVHTAAVEHARTASIVSDAIEAMIWGAACGLAIYYAREFVRSVWDFAHE